jgi:hypothetical protein
MPTIDVIGDIHGQADKLRRLLDRLGYKQNGGVYGSPDREAIFVGDLIDRGPKIGEVIEIAAGMLKVGADCDGKPRIQRAVLSYAGREGRLSEGAFAKELCPACGDARLFPGAAI